jgi:alpha-beta hydrolase superfamily lysophospholipase
MVINDFNGGKAMKKNVEFYSEGSLVKGILYLPDNYKENEKMPAILLCHGFAGVKELLLPNYAEEFCKHGFVALTFDYRGFGESEGQPGKLSPPAQITDIRNAITFLQTLPEVDPDKLGLWGTSFGGANAIAAAGLDKRIKCLSIQLAFGDGERVITGNLSTGEKEKLNTTIMKIWSRAVTQNKMMQVPIHKVLNDEQSIEFYNKTVDKHPELNIKIPFLTIMETMEHKPEKYLETIHIPILIMAAENDRVNPKEESEILYQKANEPKELHIVKGASHYEIYEGEFFKEVAAKQLAWFNKYLPGA